MRVVIQRISKAAVTVDLQQVASVGMGMLILLGIEHNDKEEDADWLCSKISKLRIFNDSEGVMNLSIGEVNGQLLIVSQFTLHASTRKGNRPSYVRSARPDKAIPLYEYFIKKMEIESSVVPACGVFGADMKVELINDGPVTILMDSASRE
ncbi:MAG: D-aminoacyl-tRNA deacylase [Bacteroidales bacterium]|nr:D-aminoacyl-tRNA deacylase [Bacteroidales bacterium]